MAFTHQDYRIINQQICFQGKFATVLHYHLTHRLFNHEWSEPLERELLDRPSAVAVLPYDPVRDEVVLIEQFRIGALSHPTSPWLIEIIAGLIDEKEHPFDVAHREALEEANCKLQELIPIGDYFVSPGGSNEYLHLFCAKTDSSNIQGIHGLAEEQEDIRVFTMPAAEAFALLEQNTIKMAPAIIALQWLMLNRNRLKQLWGNHLNQND